MRYKAFILWGIFAGVVLLGTVYITQIIDGTVHSSILNLSGANPTGIVILVLATLLLILHSAWTMGFVKSLSLLSLSFLAGLAFEVVGVKSGIAFGGTYVYNPAIQPAVAGVPLLIPLIWAGFIYGGYAIVSSFSIWTISKTAEKSAYTIRQQAVFSALCALVVLAIDLVMEPLQVQAGNWRWLDSGYYFDIPAGNFIGWFMLSFLVIVSFRLLQRYLPQPPESAGDHVMLIPVIGYGLLCIVLAGWAISSGMMPMALIGLGTMLPVATAGIVLFVRSRMLHGHTAC